jgi:phenylacetic acid degradation operon negative regulatory protein
MAQMTPRKPPEAAARSRVTRTLMVTFLGSIVRRMGNWMPIAGTVELMAQCGQDTPSVRTAVFRLKQRGWLAAESRNGRRGYSLTPVALKVLSDGDEIIWHARQPAALADGWCIVNFSVPESHRAQRHQLRAHLASLGFGNVGTAIWIAPARMRGAAEQAIATLGLAEYSAIFVGSYVGGQDLQRLLFESWDLAEIDRRYRDFISRYQPEIARLDGVGTLEPQQAFVDYLTVVDQWRKLPFSDPGLPSELLGDDWSAPAATAVFERLVALLEGRALAHAAGHW